MARRRFGSDVFVARFGFVDFVGYRRWRRRPAGAPAATRRANNRYERRRLDQFEQWDAAGFELPSRSDCSTDDPRARGDVWVEACRDELARCLSALPASAGLTPRRTNHEQH